MNTSSTQQSLPTTSGVQDITRQEQYINHILIAIIVILGLPLVTLVRRWVVNRRLAREAGVKRYEAIEQELCSPEELFAEKLLNEEYADALDIANKYKLDPDPVYQKQWLKEGMTVESIKNFLVKVNDRSWVINECLKRIPPTLAVASALLDLGISLTDAGYFVAIDEVQKNDDKDEGARDPRQIIADNFESFSEQEKEMLVCRCQLIRYKRRLKTLEQILGGEDIAEYHYKPEVYKRIREECILRSAMRYARSGNVEALSVLFTRHGNQTLDHWLLILSNFPEVVSPFVYQKLLPDCSITDSEVYPWEQEEVPEEDWSDIFAPLDNESEDFAATLYEEPEFRELKEFRGRNLVKSRLTMWFFQRARQIEQLTNLVDNALQLVKLGIQKNLEGLMQLHQDMEIFSIVIYECFPRIDSPPELVFDDFLLLKPNQVIDLLMIGSEKDGKLFVKCFRNFLVPYIRKMDNAFPSGSLHPYAQSFILKIAAKDISLVTNLFQSCVPDPESIGVRDVAPVIDNVEDLLKLALDVLYQDVGVHESKYLENAFSIVECLPQRSPDSSPAVDALQDRVDILEKHLAVCEACAKYSFAVFPRRLLQLQTEKRSSEVLLFLRELIQKGAKSFKVLNEPEWIHMLDDVMQIHNDCFNDIVSRQEVQNLFIRCLLTHGKKDFFGLAIRLIRSLGVDNCTELIIEATRDYTNSANSLTDKSIELAKTCLQLLSPEAAERHPEVRQEKDFLQLLNVIHQHFDLPLLPIQIRLIEQPKLDLIHRIVSGKQKAYREAEQLLQVARLARVCQDQKADSRDAAVLNIAGEAALSNNDYSACMTICEKLMSLEDTSGWCLCLKLGSNSMFKSASSKLKLLSFALMNCDVDSSGKKLAVILDKIETLKEEYKNEKSRAQKQQEILAQVITEGTNVVAAGVDQARVLSDGAQIFSTEVSKAATGLTNWLLPTLKTIKKDIVDKSLPIVTKPIDRLVSLSEHVVPAQVSAVESERMALNANNSEETQLGTKESINTIVSKVTEPSNPVYASSESKKTSFPPTLDKPQKSVKPTAANKDSVLKGKRVKGKVRPIVVEDPEEEWDDWDSPASSTTTSRASSVKSDDIERSSSVTKKPVVKKPVVVEDDVDGNWDDW